MSTPSHYNAINLEKIKSRMPVYSQNSKLVRFKPILKVDLPSPASYETNDRRLSYRNNSPKTKFGKSKADNYI